jgi:hypothetical protein
MRTIFIIILFIINFNIYSQNNTEFIDVDYIDYRRDSMYNCIDIRLNDSNERLIHFTTGFDNDSILVFQNNNLVFSKKISSNIRNSFAKGLIIKVNDFNCYNYIKIKLVNKNITIDFPFDVRFRLLKIIRNESNFQGISNNSWTLTYTNCAPNYH